jgi:hypothetical protein
MPLVAGDDVIGLRACAQCRNFVSPGSAETAAEPSGRKSSPCCETWQAPRRSRPAETQILAGERRRVFLEGAPPRNRGATCPDVSRAGSASLPAGDRRPETNTLVSMTAQITSLLGFRVRFAPGGPPQCSCDKAGIGSRRPPQPFGGASSPECRHERKWRGLRCW